ncbi:metal ABC transporter permease [Peptoniphilus mikwangii]|uniref:metal ABC transporter permease n=1 Tax=Peptoniphilus mikwangii TaxID=1354300 RepID=UPI0004030651|nr:metal ABC transporter permease [Peptoniphilus mikwangii]
MEIFRYSYMIKAMLVGFVLSIIIPFMGIVIVNKKISVIGDALSHVSLAGVMIGLISGITPTLGAVVTCIFAGLMLEYIRKKFPSYQEISTAIIMSTGIGLASILSGFVKKAANFESFLFGSIIAISPVEFYLIIIISIVVFFTFLYLYRDLMHISFDETSARLSGIDVDRVNTIFMILIAITISVAAKTVGILIISSLMVVPVACAMKFEVGYFKTIIISSLFGVLFTMSGLVISFYLGLKPGGTIVLIGVITLLVILAFSGRISKKR